MSARTSRMKWGRVVVAGVGANLVDDLVFAIIPFSGWLLAPVAFWVVPVLTAFFALWVARTVRPSAAVRHGFAVGAIAAVLVFVIGLPSLGALPAGAVTVAAGLMGGLLGQRMRRGTESPVVRD